MKKLLCIIVSLPLFTSCVYNDDKKVVANDNIINNIRTYMEKAPKFMIINNDGTTSVEENIYIVNFISVDDGGYLTVRTFNNIPYNLSDERYYFLGDTLNNNKIIYIIDKNDIPNVVNISDSAIEKARYFHSTIQMMSVYDGTRYPKTYRYIYKKNANIELYPVDTLIVKMLGQEYVDYENYLKR